MTDRWAVLLTQDDGTLVVSEIKEMTHPPDVPGPRYRVVEAEPEWGSGTIVNAAPKANRGNPARSHLPSEPPAA
jgi:hypothetical protein